MQKYIFNIIVDKYKDYYLTGGTALEMYYHHRFSEDLDFFSQNYNTDVIAEIIKYTSDKTDFLFELTEEQVDKKFVPMQVYFVDIGNDAILKVDFVKDYVANKNKIQDGLHSLEDIYFRKIIAAIGFEKGNNATGSQINMGRQTAKDLFDIYYLSINYKSLVNFFFDNFARDRIPALLCWYRAFNRMELRLELNDLGIKEDPKEVISYLDKEILEKLPDRLIEGV